MSDDDLTEQLNRFAGYLMREKLLRLSDEQIMHAVALHLRAIARNIRHECTRREEGVT